MEKTASQIADYVLEKTAIRVAPGALQTVSSRSTFKPIVELTERMTPRFKTVPGPSFELAYPWYTHHSGLLRKLPEHLAPIRRVIRGPTSRMRTREMLPPDEFGDFAGKLSKMVDPLTESLYGPQMDLALLRFVPKHKRRALFEEIQKAKG